MRYDWNAPDRDLPYGSYLLNLATLKYAPIFTQWIDTETGEYGVCRHDPVKMQTIVDEATGGVLVDVFQMDPRHMWIEWGNQPALSNARKTMLRSIFVEQRWSSSEGHNAPSIERERERQGVPRCRSFRKCAMVRIDEPHDPPEPKVDTWRDRPPLL